MKLSPSQIVIGYFGGVRAAAKILGRSPASVCKWQKYVDKSGNKGGVPRALHTTILKKAKKLNLKITPDDLIYGRHVK